MPNALITGITGQDGSYLAELLLNKGYTVHGVVRRASSFNRGRLEHMFDDTHFGSSPLVLHYGDLTDASVIRRILSEAEPDEVYNLAAQSHVRVSFELPMHTADVGALGTLGLLEAIRDYSVTAKRDVKMYQAGSSEMFGSSPPPQDESTPFHPCSPYAVAKAAAHWFAVNYREAYGLYVCNGILFNHESPRRGETFVTRKITRAVGRIAHGLQDKLYLGNLDAKRDWGYAGDYVDAMWRMLQQEHPDDYVVATGESHTVREFLEEAFAHADLDWRQFVEFDRRHERPVEVDALCGDSSKASRVLDWRPSVSFSALVQMMVQADMTLAKRELTVIEAGD
ncbi:MAG: GDP-mannose 4,6-dehydratase [Proteobacteria bacterium]|nr:GDP-mannose 4,6-dehydratase [Pseudomonadota bacterium]